MNSYNNTEIVSNIISKRKLYYCMNLFWDGHPFFENGCKLNIIHSFFMINHRYRGSVQLSIPYTNYCFLVPYIIRNINTEPTFLIFFVRNSYILKIWLVGGDEISYSGSVSVRTELKICIVIDPSHIKFNFLHWLNWIKQSFLFRVSCLIIF